MQAKLTFPLLFILVDEPVQQPIQAPPEEYSLRSSNPTEYHEYIYASGKLMRETVTTTANGTSTTEVLTTGMRIHYVGNVAKHIFCDFKFK